MKLTSRTRSLTCFTPTAWPANTGSLTVPLSKQRAQMRGQRYD
jgi:hypothetical protein